MNDHHGERRITRPRLVIILAIVAAIAIFVSLQVSGWNGLRPASGSAAAMAAAADRPLDGSTQRRAE
jgi:hypothetical protein